MPNPLPDLKQLLQWTTRGENCPMCNALRGRVYAYDMWMSAGVWPGFHLNCDCYLKKVGADTPVSDPDFFGADLNLLSETLNINFGNFLRLHWDPNYRSFAWYMAEQITQAHLAYGSENSISQILKLMKNDFQGFFKRSTLFDNFFIWRTFRTLKHYQNIDGGYSGEQQRLLRRYAFPTLKPRTGSTFYRYNQMPYLNSILKPDSLVPFSPQQSNYSEEH